MDICIITNLAMYLAILGKVCTCINTLLASRTVFPDKTYSLLLSMAALDSNLTKKHLTAEVLRSFFLLFYLRP